MFRVVSFFRAAVASDLLLKHLTLYAVIITAVIYFLQLTVSSAQLISSIEQGDSQLRAYVGPVDVQVSTTANANTFDIAVDVKNFGQTPAFDVGLTYLNAVQFPRDGNLFAEQSATFPDQTYFNVLYPNSQSHHVDRIKFEDDDLQNILDGKKIIVFQAKIWYTTFKENDVWSTLCYVFDQKQIKAIKDGKIKVGLDQQTQGTSCGNGFNAT